MHTAAHAHELGDSPTALRFIYVAMAARGLARLFLLVNLYQSFMPATGLTAGDLEFHLNGGWCESAGTVDDCTVKEVPCANGEDADAAAACWNLCEDEYPNQVEAVDIDDTEINAASRSNCMCCCQTKCDCVSDIKQVGGKSFAVPKAGYNGCTLAPTPQPTTPQPTTPLPTMGGETVEAAEARFATSVVVIAASIITALLFA